VEAPSDVTRSSSCAITYYLAANPDVQRKLQKELDEALESEDDSATSFEVVKNLPYLDAVINEALRLHSTSGIGLPRIVPEGGMSIQGHFFKEGTVLSVPSYTIHRDREVWGDDAAIYRPERWFERDNDAIQRTFNPFSYGPRCVMPEAVSLLTANDTLLRRACVGRNLAVLELLIIISSIFYRYEIVLEHPDESVRR
jgi:benzoate 4-monooxygenase